MTLARFDAASRARSWCPSTVVGLCALLFGAAACGGSVETGPFPGGAGGTGTSTTSAGGSGGGAGHGAAPSGGGGAGGEQGGTSPWSEPPVALEELDLGVHPTSGVPIVFPIPDRTLGFTVLATAPASEQVLGIYQLKPVGGNSVIYNFAMVGHDLTVFADQGWCTCADPQSDSADAMPVKPGDWRVSLGTDGTATEGGVRVWARRTLDGAFHGGVVDVNVFVAPGTVDQGYLSQMLSSYFFPWAGLGAGNITFQSIGNEYTYISSYAAYRALLESSASAGTEPALNVFVVGGFGGELQGAAGVAGGIPGSPMQHGTARSGVAYIPTGDPGYDGVILTHEVGHIGGLFHTTEMAPDFQDTDPLSDTVECDWNTIQSNPGSCPDVNNVMFPIAFGATAFSQAQLKVIEGSAIYRGILQEGGQPSGPLAMVLPPGGAARSLLGPSTPLRGGVAPTKLRAPRDELERLLSAGWCPSAGDTGALALRLAGPTARSRLESIARDPGAFDMARGRALHLLERAASGDRAALRSAERLGAALLTAPGSGRQLRLAALDLLARHAEERLPAVVAQLAPGTDSAVDTRLHQLGLR